MAIRTQAEFAALYGLTGTSFPDNTTGLITEAVMRQLGQDINDTYGFKYDSYTVTATGTNTYAITLSGISAYATNQKFSVKFTNANTGASTINLNSLGAKSIVKNGSTALVSGDIAAGQIVDLVYDGTNFQMTGSSSQARMLSGVASIDFGSMGTLTQVTSTISVTGAAVNDLVLVGYGSSTVSNDIILDGYVSAADTVTVRAHNVSSGTIDPPSRSVRVMVFKT